MTLMCEAYIIVLASLTIFISFISVDSSSLKATAKPGIVRLTCQSLAALGRFLANAVSWRPERSGIKQTVS